MYLQSFYSNPKYCQIRGDGKVEINKLFTGYNRSLCDFINDKICLNNRIVRDASGKTWVSEREALVASMWLNKSNLLRVVDFYISHHTNLEESREMFKEHVKNIKENIDIKYELATMTKDVCKPKENYITERDVYEMNKPPIQNLKHLCTILSLYEPYILEEFMLVDRPLVKKILFTQQDNINSYLTSKYNDSYYVRRIEYKDHGKYDYIYQVSDELIDEILVVIRILMRD